MSLTETEQNNISLQIFDDAEETLSFCDLPLSNGSASDQQDFCKEDQSMCFEDDFFEFFSEDFTASAHTVDNIIFCGKLIPFKDPKVADKAINLNAAMKPQETKNSGISTWKLNRSRTIAPRTRLTTPVKSRWYVLTFGSGSFPVEMGLSDIRARLSKKYLQAEKMFQSHNGKEVKKNVTVGRRGKSFWSLFTEFGCTRCHANAVVKPSSFRCTPSVKV